MQLRFGKKYNFNFQAHKSDKVGVLRSYVKKMRAQDDKKQGKNSSMIEKMTKKDSKMIDELLDWKNWKIIAVDIISLSYKARIFVFTLK